MTKLLTPKILLILLMSFFSTTAIAHDIEVKNADGVTIYYNWINNKTELGVSYRGDDYHNYRDRYSGNVVIPESVKYNGKTYSVTSIGESAFYGCSSLTSIAIPNSVTSISWGAFHGCSSLTSIAIPNSVTDIGGYAFYRCSGLTSLSIPNSVTSIGVDAFGFCGGLTSINVESGNIKYDSRDNCNAIIETSSNTLIAGSTNTIIPNSVTSIGYGAFKGRSGLTSITFPNSVTEIQHEAFMHCTGLTSIELPNSIKRIGSDAFYNCSISTVTIPSSVTNIAPTHGSSPFNGCKSLISIKVESGNTVYDSRNNCNAIIETATNELIAGCKTTIIPNSVTSIGYNSMCSFKDLTSITIPSSVTSIAFGAFNNCGLTSITIPNSVTSIGEYAFSCSSLTSVISKIQIPFVINNCFDDNVHFKATLTVPKGTKAAYQATEGWNKFSNIVEAGGANQGGEIGDMFYYNGINYQINESGTVEVISADNNLTNVTIPETVSYNGNTYTVTALTERSFEGRSDITYLSIPSTITSIGEYSFINCGSNIDVNISSLSAWCRIDFGNEHASPLSSARAFYLNGEEVKDLTIPYGTVTVPKFAFYQCRSIESVSIPGSVKTIDSSAFEDCSGVTSVSLVDGLTLIGGSAFEGCRGISSVTIPSSVTLIGINAFKNCSGLTNVTSEIQTPFDISDSVFEGIASDATLIVPWGTKSAYQSKAGWKNFANIIDNGGSEIIETKRTIHVAIAGTLRNLISEEEKYQIEELTLTGEINGADFWTIREMLGARNELSPRYNYNNVLGKKDAKLTKLDISGARIVAGGCYMWTHDSEDGGDLYIEESDVLPTLVFDGCKGLSSIVIPDNVKTIGSFALRGTDWYESQPDGLVYLGNVLYGYKGEMPEETSVIIKNGTIGIGGSAFTNCQNLVSISIPESVTNIGGGGDDLGMADISSGPFSGCIGITSISIPKSVTDIGYRAFYGCSNLTSINIPNGVKSIKRYAFYKCSSLSSITIPISVNSIESLAFYGCSGLTSIVFPNSVESLGYAAFSGCMLTSIVSEIKIPFVIIDVFDKEIYATVKLTVPKDTKYAYQTTYGWKEFTNIVEEGTMDGAEIVMDGITYQGSMLDNTAMVKSVDPSLTSVEIPASVSYDGTNYQVTGNDDHAFDGSTMVALIWDVEAALSSKAFNNANIGSNFLLYVRSASYAPSSVKNVVVNGSAQSIVLSDDGGQFYCPQAFTAEKISYTHYYNMETGGEGKGWETIALPFNVQKISHSTRGEIIPFASYSSGSSEKPFWLANMSSSGFRRTSNIQSNEPYIIAMPNNNSYQNDYILTGDVTFSAENASVPKTPTFSGKFVPTFSTISKSSNVFALNAVNKYVSATGGYDPGSRFISNLRDVRPFEAYISSSSSTRGVIEINFDDDKTGLDTILFSTDESREVTIYTISGRKVGTSQKGRLDETIEQLPKGVYIVNGRKIVK